MWGSRVIVPHKLQAKVFPALHKLSQVKSFVTQITFRCCCKMKSMLRSYVWCPGLDRQIEDLAKT